jgi:chloramphenicol O-acetyltransferase type A
LPYACEKLCISSFHPFFITSTLIASASSSQRRLFSYLFRIRIENGEVVEYDKINISPTIGREDGTFGFGFFEYDTDLSLFIENAEKEIHRVKNSTGLSFSKDTARADVIRYSALPWFAFSEMKHAGSIQTGDSIPKISIGKLIQEKKKLLLPISISVHHGLVDGRNVAEFIQNVKDGQNNTL